MRVGSIKVERHHCRQNLFRYFYYISFRFAYRSSRLSLIRFLVSFWRLVNLYIIYILFTRLYPTFFPFCLGLYSLKSAIKEKKRKKDLPSPPYITKRVKKYRSRWHTHINDVMSTVCFSFVSGGLFVDVQLFLEAPALFYIAWCSLYHHWTGARLVYNKLALSRLQLISLYISRVSWSAVACIIFDNFFGSIALRFSRHTRMTMPKKGAAQQRRKKLLISTRLIIRPIIRLASKWNSKCSLCVFFSFAFTIFSSLMIYSSPTVSKTWICLYIIPSDLIFFLFFSAAFAETLLCNQINLREGRERREQSHSICGDVKNISPPPRAFHPRSWC